jgi:PPK2 family polyphosphate:nucleotide phosphotransferase
MREWDKRWTSDPRQSLRVRPGTSLRLLETDAHPGFDGTKGDGAASLARGSAVLSKLQEKLFAASTRGDQRRILLVLQGMDTAGKGGIVAHVVGAVNPDGTRYHAFKAPTEEELSHDFLWRVRRHLPTPGQIAVFDRSHYEDVLIGRVRELAPPAEIERRYAAINEFEAELAASGTTLIKVMLNISREEQKARLDARLRRPKKYWKFNPSDIDERLRWDDYQTAYQIVFDRTSTRAAPWFVVPADKKWYARIALQRLLIDALSDMQLSWPPADFDVDEQRERLART